MSAGSRQRGGSTGAANLLAALALPAVGWVIMASAALAASLALPALAIAAVVKSIRGRHEQ